MNACDRELLNFTLWCLAFASPVLFCAVLVLLCLDGYWSRR